MPEEKKESFTFSDKIKNSKPTGAKSFAKSSSKVGRDGKPKQTLFERTRRDAPFFIAALVALLLLPFLYKYSGQSSEDTLLSTPGSEESMFDPERYGFDTAMSMEDPDGQIAQLSGRDSLDLIRGWGNKEEDFGRDDMDFDASASGEYEGEDEYSANRSSSTNIDEEENVTNIYKRRARAGTRAAFRRTQIGKLDPTTLRRPGGSRLGINNWGGSMKDAAKKVKGSGPRNAPKPVSLQPLRAAGPARSSFGGGAARAARMGKDNMGKANAIEALRDSYVVPVGPTHTGGLDLSSDGRFGGGGKLDHNINIGKGETPWWWDMMKTRMQEEWMARFKRKWDWINFFDKLAQNILKGLINCIVTGDSDGDPDHFLGDINIGGGSTGKKECCGMNQKKWEASHPGVAFNSDACKGWMTTQFGEKYKEKCPSGWVDKSSAGGASVGFFGQRLKCLGISASGYASGDLELTGANGLKCVDMPTYKVIPSGEARKWNIYTYVVARNYFPEKLKDQLNLQALKTKNGEQNLLCAPGQSSLNHAKITGGVGYVKAQEDAARESIIAQARATSNVTEEQQKIREATLEINQEALGDGCVIVVSQGGVLPYETMKNKIMDLFKELGANESQAREAFYQLDLMFVKSFAAKNKLAYAQWFESGHSLKGLLPLPYWEFEDAYIQHKKVTHKMDGSRDDIYKYKKKWRVEGLDMVQGDICFYGNLNFECGPEDSAMATLRFNEHNFKGGKNSHGEGATPKPGDVKVTAEFRYLNNGQEGAKNPVVQPMGNPEISESGFKWNYQIVNLIDSKTTTTTKDIIHPDNEGKYDLVGTVLWTATRGAEVVTRECPLNMSGDGYTKHVHEKKCNNAQESKDCCDELMGDRPHHWQENNEKGSQCVDDSCTDPQQSRECCEKLMGSNGYLWRESPEPRCYKPDDPQPQDGLTRLAPVLSWVPINGTTQCRKPVKDNNNPTVSMFQDCKEKVPGIVPGNTQRCGSTMPIMMDSEAAAKFVRDVVKEYNEKNPNTLKLSDQFYSGKYPTDGEFVDALYFARKLGKADVPSSAVCELARDMVRMSTDPHAGKLKVSEENDFKDIPRFYRNDLGAFLAYVHPTSILYPNKYYGASRKVCDWRFLPKGSMCGIASTMKMGKAYYFNYYNDSTHNASLNSYLGSFDKVGIKKTYPLAQLVEGHSDLDHNCPTQNCASTRNQYNKDDFFGLMISDLDSVDGKGQACVAFAGNRTMKVEKAIEYVQNVCETGLDAKPYGNQSRTGAVASSAAIYDPNQKFTSTTNTRSGNDGGVQKPRGQNK